MTDEEMQAQAGRDLAFLREHGALTGVAEIIRHRRYMVEHPEQTEQMTPRDHARQVSLLALDAMRRGPDQENNMTAAGELAARFLDQMAAQAVPSGRHHAPEPAA